MKEDFIKYVKEQFGIDIKFVPCEKEKADTFESIFWHTIKD